MNEPFDHLKELHQVSDLLRQSILFYFEKRNYLFSFITFDGRQTGRE